MDRNTKIKVDGALTTYGEWIDRVWPDKDSRRDIEFSMAEGSYKPEGDERCSRLFNTMELA